VMVQPAGTVCRPAGVSACVSLQCVWTILTRTHARAQLVRATSPTCVTASARRAAWMLSSRLGLCAHRTLVCGTRVCVHVCACDHVRARSDTDSTCDGTTRTCPNTTYVTLGEVCRPSVRVCTQCTAMSSSYRACARVLQAGVCDVAEQCTGHDAQVCELFCRCRACVYQPATASVPTTRSSPTVWCVARRRARAMRQRRARARRRSVHGVRLWCDRICAC
jgi:hypothetical protein